MRVVERQQGVVLSEADYRIQVLTGVIRPPILNTKPTYKSKRPSYLETALTEFDIGYWRRAGELVVEELFKSEDSRKMMIMQIHQLRSIEQKRVEAKDRLEEHALKRQEFVERIFGFGLNKHDR